MGQSHPPPNLDVMDVNAALAAASAIGRVCTGAIAVLAFRWSEREQARPTRTSLHTEAVLPPGVDTVLSVLRSSAVVLDEGDTAIVRHDSADERSVDVFYFRDGRWHAWYSQHTRKSPAG